MNSLIISLVLVAAFLHASWNAMVKSGGDRLWTMTWLMVVGGLLGAPAMVFLPAPASASWPYIAASAVIHVVYNLLLIRTYKSGDFSQTYPIARGSSPMLVSIGAFLLAGEVLGPARILGVLMVSGGIIALALQGRGLSFKSVPPALATGVSIAAYSVVDGIGGRLSGTPNAYAACLFCASGVGMALTYVCYRGTSGILRGRRDMAAALGGGIVSAAGYAIVIWAMTQTQMGAVSALRETSVVMAAVIARLFLKERLTLARLGACAVIAGGAIALSI